MNKPNLNILVLGGYGFIGRHIVEALETYKQNVFIGTRRKAKHDNERQIQLHKITDQYGWKTPLADIDVVINAVGILRQRRGESYQHVHHVAVALLADACAKLKIRLVHVSALGLNNPVKSRFLSSKFDGEHALVNSQADWFLVRPSLVDGDGGYGAKWFRRVAKWPVHFMPSNAQGLIAPIDANDLGHAVAKISLLPKEERPDASRLYQLGGESIMNLAQYLHRLRTLDKPGAKDALVLKIPSILARGLSHLCDLFHFTPFSFGHYELLKFDNIPIPNRLNELLNTEARKPLRIPINTQRGHKKSSGLDRCFSIT